jgi:trimethylamine corrinoid protein
VVFKVVIPAVEEMMSRITQDPDANLAQHFMTAQIAAEVTDKMLLCSAVRRRSSAGR